ncbi:hypothetical protein ACOSQ3_014236 [Xanthoceras sorbifolium]
MRGRRASLPHQDRLNCTLEGIEWLSNTCGSGCINRDDFGNSDCTGGFIPPDCRGSTSVDTIVLNVMLKSDESWFNVLKQ